MNLNCLRTELDVIALFLAVGNTRVRDANYSNCQPKTRTYRPQILPFFSDS